MAEIIYWALHVAIPDFDSHIVAGTCQYIGMIGRKLDFANRQLVTHQCHQRLVDRASQIENFDQVVRAGSGYKVFIFVEIDAQNSIVMGAYPLDVLAAPQIPDATSLVVGAAGENYDWTQLITFTSESGNTGWTRSISGGVGLSTGTYKVH